MEVSRQLHPPAALPSGKSPGTHWRMGGPQRQSGYLGEQHLFEEKS